MRSFTIKETDKALSEALIDKINNLTKPKGSLGLLEKTAHKSAFFAHHSVYQQGDGRANGGFSHARDAGRKAA